MFTFAALFLYGCSGNKIEKSISDNSLFVSKSEETYQCVRLRRGDKIELTGTVKAFNREGEKKFLLITDAGRKYILDENSSDLSAFEGKKIRIKSAILFEGNEEKLPVLTVIGLD